MYCIKCGKNSKSTSLKCPYCGEEYLTHELDYAETRKLNQALHSRLNNSRESFNNAMVWVVLGATFLIIGAVFFLLSHKTSPNPDIIGKVLRTDCFEFYVSMGGLCGGGFLFAVGLVRVFIQLGHQKEIKTTLEATQSGTYVHLNNSK